jgi:hypothetical protein
MAILRTIALKASGGLERCWGYELAYDDQVDLATVRLGIDDSVRVVGGRCGRPPVAEVAGSGGCADHLAQMSPAMQRGARLL